MIIYVCDKCNKNFGNKKSNYLIHINKKNPCKLNTNINLDVKNEHQIAATLHQNAATTNKIIKNEEKNITANQNFKNQNTTINLPSDKVSENKCEYCNYCFTRGSSLKTHIANRCKIKKQNDNNEKNKINELIKLNYKLIKQNEEIKKELNNIKNSSSKNNKKTNIKINNNIDTQNNISNLNNNLNIQIINYGNEKYELMDNKLFLEPMLKEIGKQIFLKIIKNIYLNPAIPENHNIMVVDKNRQICKIYNDKRWISTDFKCINELLSRIIYFAKHKYEEYKIRYANNE